MCLWESITPNTSSITLQQKIKFANMTNIGTDINSNILMNTDFTWTVHSPEHGLNPNYPQKDHTLNSASGSYLLLRNDPPRKAYDRAVLISDRFDVNGTDGLCMRFFLYLGGSNPSISSKLSAYTSENYTTVRLVYSHTGTSNSWFSWNVSIPAQSPNTRNMWLYLVCI